MWCDVMWGNFLYYTTLHYAAMHCPVKNSIVFSIVLHCVALRCVALRCVALDWSVLYCTVLYYRQFHQVSVFRSSKPLKLKNTFRSINGCEDNLLLNIWWSNLICFGTQSVLLESWLGFHVYEHPYWFCEFTIQRDTQQITTHPPIGGPMNQVVP